MVITGATTVPVNSALPSLSGKTTVSSGTTFVVITGPTTVPIATGRVSSASGAGGAQTTTPLQASKGNRKAVPGFMFLASLIFACC